MIRINDRRGLFQSKSFYDFTEKENTTAVAQLTCYKMDAAIRDAEKQELKQVLHGKEEWS